MKNKFKYIFRLKLIILGAINSTVTSLLNFALSYLVIQFKAPHFWGEIVQYLIVFNVLFNIISWGQSQYLIREFSLHSNLIDNIWKKSLVYRMFILFPFIIIIAFVYPNNLVLYLIIWVLLKFIYDSCYALIQYHRSFRFSIFVELVGMTVTILPIILMKSELEIETFFLWYCLGLFSKAMLLMVYFQKYLFKSISFHEFLKLKEIVAYFKTSFPFLIIGFIGMVQSKIDLYSVAYFMNKTALAKYQVLLSLLSFSLFFASLILSPFAKNILRLNQSSLQKLQRRFMILGIPLSAVCIIFIYVTLTFVYSFHFAISIYILGGVYIWSFYINVVKIYEYSKRNLQNKTSYYSIIGVIINLIFSILLTPLYGLQGALFATVLSQLAITGLMNFESVSFFLNGKEQ